MAALPPSGHSRRARPGSLARPVNSRLYRGTWLLVGITLLVAAFSVYHPYVLHGPVLEPQFDGATALLTAQEFASNNPDRVPGSEGAAQAATWVAQRLGQHGL